MQESPRSDVNSDDTPFRRDSTRSRIAVLIMTLYIVACVKESLSLTSHLRESAQWRLNMYLSKFVDQLSTMTASPARHMKDFCTIILFAHLEVVCMRQILNTTNVGQYESRYLDCESIMSLSHAICFSDQGNDRREQQQPLPLTSLYIHWTHSRLDTSRLTIRGCS